MSVVDIDQLNIKLSQITEDAVLIVIKADLTVFSSFQEARATCQDFMNHISEQTGKRVVLADHSVSLEQISVEQLNELGLHPVGRGTFKV